ncbi:hypothetical protein LSM04_007085 [Trypanosoma melophagium]|uniref:uncharacterized protein n=1 Tax=Trypanosoma melophagium TaxID=715481 RepID=UPI00351A027F|nr:hypothetical protein LSM04_007085 [Trypanosoma melophagium]
MQRELGQRSLTERVEDIVLSRSALPEAITADKLKDILSSLEKRNNNNKNNNINISEKQKCQTRLFGTNSICTQTSNFLVSQGSPSHLRVMSSFVAAAAHSELGKMLEWFARAVVGLFVDGVKTGVAFPQQWEESIQQHPILAKHMFELQGFGVLFSYLLCQLAAVEAAVCEEGLSGEYNNNNNNSNSNNNNSNSNCNSGKDHKHGSDDNPHRSEDNHIEERPPDVETRREMMKNSTDIYNGDMGIARRRVQESVSKPSIKTSRTVHSQLSSTGSKFSRDTTMPISITSSSQQRKHQPMPLKMTLKTQSPRLQWESVGEQEHSKESPKPSASLISLRTLSEGYKLDTSVNRYQSQQPSQRMYVGNPPATKVALQEVPLWPKRRLSEKVSISNHYVRSIPIHLKAMDMEAEESVGMGTNSGKCRNASPRKLQLTASPLRTRGIGKEEDGIHTNSVSMTAIADSVRDGREGKSTIITTTSNSNSARLSAFRPTPLRLEDIEQEMRSRELRKLYGVSTIVNYAQRELRDYGKKMQVFRAVLDSGDGEREHKEVS